MEMLFVALAGVAGAVGGMFAGLSVGEWTRSRASFVFWLTGVGIVLAGSLVVLFGQVIGVLYLAVAGVGLTGGGLTGLKYGSGRTRLRHPGSDEDADRSRKKT